MQIGSCHFSVDTTPRVCFELYLASVGGRWSRTWWEPGPGDPKCALGVSSCQIKLLKVGVLCHFPGCPFMPVFFLPHLCFRIVQCADLSESVLSSSEEQEIRMGARDQGGSKRSG